MREFYFNLPEVICLIGLAQCLYLVVYMVARAGKSSHVSLPILYFSVLGFALFLDLAARNLQGIALPYSQIQWLVWNYGPPLSVLLIIQIAQLGRLPSPKYFWVLALPPLSFLLSYRFARGTEYFNESLSLSGLIAGSLSLMAIWTQKHLIESVHAQKGGKERYWLIISLIGMNILFLVLLVLDLGPGFEGADIVMARGIFGLGLVYLVNTSLFRIYPQAVRISPGAGDAPAGRGGLTDQETELGQKIERLMREDKLYQELSFSRADLARECNTSEAVISRVINEYFGKTLPQLINELRVEDAKALLSQTEASIQVIAKESGFNSTASFNRVFKEITGYAPSIFRKKK